MRATGDLRDEEVLEETLDGVSEHPAFAGWLRTRATREKKLRRAVLLRIERGELDRARLMLQGTSDDAATLAIDDRVELVLRRYTVERGVPVYGFKVQKVDERERVETS